MPHRSPPPDRRQEFDREASTYDAEAVSTMPGYSELHRMLVWGIPFSPTRGFRVLELGVGTGTLTASILETFPHAVVTGIDLSPRMIAEGRRKLRPWKERVTLETGELDEFDGDAEYDVVVSALAIHHLTNPKKRRLFRRIAGVLTPGGYFGDGDDHLPEDRTFDARYAQIAAGIPPAVIPHARAAPLPQRAWHQHEQFDRPWSVGDEISALRAAGFEHVGIPWQFFAQAVAWSYR